MPSTVFLWHYWSILLHTPNILTCIKFPLVPTSPTIFLVLREIWSRKQMPKRKYWQPYEIRHECLSCLRITVLPANRQSLKSWVVSYLIYRAECGLIHGCRGFYIAADWHIVNCHLFDNSITIHIHSWLLKFFSIIMVTNINLSYASFCVSNLQLSCRS